MGELCEDDDVVYFYSHYYVGLTLHDFSATVMNEQSLYCKENIPCAHNTEASQSTCRTLQCPFGTANQVRTHVPVVKNGKANRETIRRNSVIQPAPLIMRVRYGEPEKRLQKPSA
jgi:hypothetical protein